MAAYLDHAEAVLGPHIGREAGPLAIKLRVGLRTGTSHITGGRDLDNFLLPLAQRLDGKRICSAWAEKDLGAGSLVSAGPVGALEPGGPPGWSFFSILTTKSAGTSAWKEEIAEVVPHDEIPSGPVEMQLAFIVHPERNWLSLWKPAIDALGNILGSDDLRPFHPRDDRIVRLALHRRESPAVGWRVGVGVWWRPHNATSTQATE